MEGLIPLVFRKVRRTKTRRQYQCLSSATAAQSYNIDDFYVDSRSHVYTTPSTEKIGSFHAERNRHRRHKSSGDYSGGYFPADSDDRVKGATPPMSKQIVASRTRSHRIFSCITGA